jgi:hypothetical protein
MSSTSGGVSGGVCPSCGSRFRAGFVRCDACKADLVDDESYATAQRAKSKPRAALEGKKTVAIVHAGLPACREIERALLADGVPCFVDAVAEEGEALAPGALKVGVMVAEEDVGRAADVLRKQFEALLKKEGSGALVAEAIDLSQSEITCPACGHKGALVDGACADCGLFLGAPDGA